MSRSKVIRILKPSETNLVPPTGNNPVVDGSLLMNDRALGHMLMIPVGTLRRWRLTGGGPPCLNSTAGPVQTSGRDDVARDQAW